MKNRPNEKHDRNAEIFRLNREEKISYNRLAKKFELTTQRIAAIIRREKIRHELV